MNKFGIFNLLNSFFDFFNKQSGQSENQTVKQTSNENPLSNLFSAFNANPEKEQKNLSSAKPSLAKKPLVSPMLTTMNNHDQIVKRVKENKKAHP